MKNKGNKISKRIKNNTHSQSSETLSAEELKQYVSECEERYHASFKSYSCKETMDSYYKWQDAKKRYHVAIGARKPTEDSFDAFIDSLMNENENCKLNCDF